MRHYTYLFAVLVTLLLGSGSFILYEAISESSHDQLAALIGGSFLISLGLLCLFFEGKCLLQWMQDSRMDGTGNQ